MRWRLLCTCLAVGLVMSVAGCARGSLTTEDVDANVAKLLEITAGGPGTEEAYAALSGTVITADFETDIGFEGDGSLQRTTDLLKLQVLPVLWEGSKQGDVEADIKGDTLILQTDDNRVRVEFVEYGDVFLIKRLSD